MSWIELHWGVPRALADLLSNKLFELGALGIQEDFLPGETPPPRQPWDVGPIPPLPRYLLLKGWWEIAAQEEIKLKILALHQSFTETHAPQWQVIAEEDWGEAWKDNFHRHQIAENLAVAPPWEAQAGDLVIEPGIAFGTGEHPTTYSCLEAIALWARPGKKCLDVGCGSGILALAAVKLGMVARGVDIEEQAIVSAYENAKCNGLRALFEQTDIADIEEQYDVVVANLYAEVLVALAPDISRCVRDKIALAGILVSKESMVLQAYASFRVLRRQVDGDWLSLWLQR